MIALCSKYYNVDEQDSVKKKFSPKGMSKRQNNTTWQRSKRRSTAALIEEKAEDFVRATERWPLMSSRS